MTYISTVRNVFLAGLFALPTHAMAEMVSLTSKDQSISLEGELIGLENGAYVVQTAVGEMRIPRELVDCEGEGCPMVLRNPNGFVVSGSNTIGASLMPNLINTFSAAYGLNVFETLDANEQTQTRVYTIQDDDLNPFANVELVSHGSQSGIQDLLDGTADIALTSRRMDPAEVREMANAGLGDASDPSNQYVIGLDGLIITVAQGNPVSALTPAQISAIFSGQIGNWRQVGGPNAPINLYVRNDGSGSAEFFASQFLSQTGTRFANQVFSFESDAALAAAVASDPNGIGFTSFAFQGNTRAIMIQDSCGLTARPTEFSIKSGEYPLTRELYLYASSARFEGGEERTAKIEGFLQFVQSDQAQRAIADTGFVNQTVLSLPVERQGQRMLDAVVEDQSGLTLSRLRDTLAAFSRADRLSTTFRFQSGSSDLNIQAIGDIPRLVDYILSQDMTGKEVLFAGFSDSDGTSSQNRRLSLNRARKVMEMVIESMGGDAGRYQFSAQGFGEFSPIACNTTPENRSMNRRVEVWIRTIR